MTRSKSNQTAKKRATRVLIVDDHPPVREALTIRLALEADLEVCGEAADVAEALQVFDATNPDVAVIDIALKGGDGIDLIKRIKARNDSVRLLVWSMYSENLCAERALRAGALGYINKEQATDQIIVAIRRVLDGKVYLSDAMAEKLLHRTVGERGASVGRSPIDTLSDRELEVFRRIGQGVKTQDIATQMHLSVKTVESYRDRIRIKLNLCTGLELSRYALLWVLENG
jgi:DNA-binding NarL/FixJ family response regulator